MMMVWSLTRLSGAPLEDYCGELIKEPRAVTLGIFCFSFIFDPLPHHEMC